MAVAGYSQVQDGQWAGCGTVLPREGLVSVVMSTAMDTRAYFIQECDSHVVCCWAETSRLLLEEKLTPETQRQKQENTDAYCCDVFNSKSLETTQMSVKGDWLDKKLYVLITAFYRTSVSFYGAMSSILLRRKKARSRKM